MKKILLLLVLAIVLQSCSEFEKAIKSEDVSLKAIAAKKTFEAKKYTKALRLFEQFASAYKGRPDSEEIHYMYAESYFKTKQYESAGYQFESFASSYPKSDKKETASFLSAKCYTLLSPRYSLDQRDTDKAVNKLQEFIDIYPNSTYLPEANLVMKDLKYKLEKKSFEVAKQYNTISDYKSAIISLDNFILDFPGTSFKEEALYYILDSSYNLAINSVPEKMEERLNDAKAAYSTLFKFYSTPKNKDKANAMLAEIDKELKKITNK